MLYNINNNNYISVLDIQLWMMHCLLIYYRDDYTCQNYWLQIVYLHVFVCHVSKLLSYQNKKSWYSTILSLLNYLKACPINLIIPININIVIFM